MSQVTDPVMLDSTGQIIVSKLQDVIDAINGGTIDPLTVTQNGTYTPSGATLGYGPVTVNVQGGGGGGNVIISDSVPSPSAGQIGQYCIYEASEIVVGSTITYKLEITKAARDTNLNFTYWGAREIDLIFTDGNQDYHFRNLTGATCFACYGSNKYNASGVIDGSTNSYAEYSGIPGWWEFTAQIPDGLSFKTLSVCGRNDSTWKDFWVSFNFGQKGMPDAIISESNLAYTDWNHAAQDSFTDFSPHNPVAPTYAANGSYLYYKTINGWVSLS